MKTLIALGGVALVLVGLDYVLLPLGLALTAGGIALVVRRFKTA